MDTEHQDELSSRERQSLNGLPRENVPPPFLEERIVEALKESNLIRPLGTSWWPSFHKIPIAFAASLVLFILGGLTGVWWASAPAPKKGMPEFLLVLREAPGQSQAISADEELRLVKEYSAWARELRQEGLLIGGEKLKQEIRSLRAADGRISVSEEQTEPGGNAIAGYFLILAKDYEHAITISRTCPHLKYGGSVEVRQIDDL